MAIRAGSSVGRRPLLLRAPIPLTFRPTALCPTVGVGPLPIVLASLPGLLVLSPAGLPVPSALLGLLPGFLVRLVPLVALAPPVLPVAVVLRRPPVVVALALSLLAALTAFTSTPRQLLSLRGCEIEDLLHDVDGAVLTLLLVEVQQVAHGHALAWLLLADQPGLVREDVGAVRLLDEAEVLAPVPGLHHTAAPVFYHCRAPMLSAHEGG
mmetsp:Transcript_108351/g.288333  ORF Transcript_108351/g.288333 Transcript_108351/m.288333 type:complete len:210 (-) Transcript_108351:17-646(-)|eukprot:CAMPEP_0171160178 /NCGR_PEP_ID=MMETSP0790-20130122/3421_1 /TAXON_ID=2925 /ORGANISM="Alexandrium catenella, Strain OF101" /LENGTH=209 /DNA_ID=CAMNT_0011624699 /DNA_START=65 /DNA_END=694 /DNA_ORIENTATION=-